MQTKTQGIGAVWHLILMIVSPLVGLYRFARSIVLAAVKERLMRRAREAVRIFGSAFAYQPVIVPLLSSLEHWAAREMEKDGTATVNGDRVELGVSRVAPSVLQEMSWRGRF